jgi:hypothetical protein
MTILFENVNYLSGALNATVKRTPAARAGDVFNIFDFGGANPPDPTGVNDSWPAIQAAVYAAGTRGGWPSGGGRVYIPAGLYKVSTPIDLSTTATGLYICGDGKASILRATCPGFVLCWAGNIGGGGGAEIQLTGASNNGSGLIRFTITATGQSPGFAPKPTKLICQNMPYTINIVGGTGSVGALNGTTVRFLIASDTQIDVAGSVWGSGGTLSSGSIVGGSNANTSLTIADLTVTNGQFDVNSGAVFIGYSSNQSNVSNCALQGYIGADVASDIWIGGSFGVSVSDCIFTCIGTFGQADKSDTGGQYAGGPPGSVGLYLGEGIAWNCRMQLFEVGYALGGSAPNLIGCSVERCNIGLIIGKRHDNPNDTTQGCTVSGVQFERCNQPVIVGNMNSGVIQGNIYLSSNGTPNLSNFSGGTWAGGTVTLTTANNHNIGVGGTQVYININSIGSLNAFLANWIPPGQRSNNILCTVGAANTLTYPLAVSPAGGTTFTGGNWTLGPIAAVTVVSAISCVFAGNDTPDFPNTSYDLSSPFGIHRNCIIMSDVMSAGIKLPVAINKASWKLINCGVYEGNFDLNFGDLPKLPIGTTSNQPGPVKGQTYTIVDGQTFSGGSSADFTPLIGSLVRGGGSAILETWYNGVDWYCTKTLAPALTFTIATLPTGQAAGIRTIVTNGVASPAFGAVVGATGAVASPVYYEGTNWRYG